MFSRPARTRGGGKSARVFRDDDDDGDDDDDDSDVGLPARIGEPTAREGMNFYSSCHRIAFCPFPSFSKVEMQISGDRRSRGLPALGTLSKYAGLPTEEVDCEFSSSFYMQIRYHAGSDS
ncbi:hypothetical protein PUN28_005946 [Cardiocondyla obscurior]|uniref:Uncharacterized protein n=1 Tax=Cardiocondyla obscurior TaxID=286306 RepID=A0AAW2GBW6_9HYME